MKIYYLIFFIFIVIYLAFNFYIILRVWKLRIAKDKTPVAISIYLLAMAFIILMTFFWMSIF